MEVYVIHCKQHTERLINIQKHLKINFPDLKIWDGTYIDHDVPEIEKELQHHNSELKLKNKNSFKTIGEIGCYLSHHNLLKHILKNKHAAKYTLILEDDCVLVDNVFQKLQEKIEKTNFDILYLGLNNTNKGRCIIDDIYSINKQKDVLGTHAYVINNTQINKIYKSTLLINGPIDYQYETEIKNDTINAVVIYPYLCYQDRESFYSTIKKTSNKPRQKINAKNITQEPFQLVYETTSRMFKNSSRIDDLIKSEKTLQQPASSTQPQIQSQNIRKRTKTRRIIVR